MNVEELPRTDGRPRLVEQSAIAVRRDSQPLRARRKNKLIQQFARLPICGRPEWASRRAIGE
jgi:hypothetical protein